MIPFMGPSSCAGQQLVYGQGTGAEGIGSISGQFALVVAQAPAIVREP
jgi:hypothetical protein